MKYIVAGLMVFSVGSLAAPERVNLRPGQSHTIKKNKKLRNDVVVRCVDKLTCVLKLRYVGKMWEVIRPGGKIQGEFKSRADADREVQRLLRIGVCERTRIYKE